MRLEILGLALLVGVATYLFRVLPLMRREAPRDGAREGAWSRFQAAVGPAAIATLFVASLIPEVQDPARHAPLAAGVLAVVVVYFWRRSVVLATLAGSLAYGVAFALV